jgi:hypothetical protein
MKIIFSKEVWRGGISGDLPYFCGSGAFLLPYPTFERLWGAISVTVFFGNVLLRHAEAAFFGHSLLISLYHDGASFPLVWLPAYHGSIADLTL